ncbi:glucose-6-phosphate isomerase [Parachitinimonas caeni]|uniref:Glucose-6-phosphate isomerase n=1 Tax=Parachitinimonas caeni TaxID=3031301 RepID=A0ABT7DXQ7_9NEIS|nr:glucose-6-phosphate isomerase [Parachitinimonas caeni]MDK2123955.1 glucose-6-phosphate isomerase [Parachitinimonas caeni]
MSALTESPAWQALGKHFQAISGLHMRELFAADPGRSDVMSIEACDILLDYSKNRVTPTTLKLLIDLALQAGLPDRIEAMFNGEKINVTENRAVLHTALRNRANTPVIVDGEDVMPKVNSVLERMGNFCNAVRNGDWLGYTGQPITDIVNIGIGGSDLGPLMVCEALKAFGHPRLNMHFVSNVDGAQIVDTLRKCHTATTLFVIESKTFTTSETLTNAHTARDWFLRSARYESTIAKHFVAVSTNAKAVAEFGIDTNNMFEFWNWVGGRYSLWSAIGLPIALYLGRQHFLDLLAGAHEMDQHFRHTPLERNMPVMMALLGIWYVNFFGAASHVITPYNQSLHRLPAYMQQLDMESNGKSTDMNGHAVDYQTSPIIWGETGINGQHAYFQMLHQGTQLSPIDFIASIENPSTLPRHHTILLANFFAQAEAFMRGKTEAEARGELLAAGIEGEQAERLLPHKIFGGNRPSNTLLLGQLDPTTLGALIALYEHKIFCQGVIWNVNSFDQWGVELGKQLAKQIQAELDIAAPTQSHDSSTNRLINFYKQRARNG